MELYYEMKSSFWIIKYVYVAVLKRATPIYTVAGSNRSVADPGADRDERARVRAVEPPVASNTRQYLAALAVVTSEMKFNNNPNL